MVHNHFSALCLALSTSQRSELFDLLINADCARSRNVISQWRSGRTIPNLPTVKEIQNLANQFLAQLENNPYGDEKVTIYYGDPEFDAEKSKYYQLPEGNGAQATGQNTEHSEQNSKPIHPNLKVEKLPNATEGDRPVFNILGIDFFLYNRFYAALKLQTEAFQQYADMGYDKWHKLLFEIPQDSLIKHYGFDAGTLAQLQNACKDEHSFNTSMAQYQEQFRIHAAIIHRQAEVLAKPIFDIELPDLPADETEN